MNQESLAAKSNRPIPSMRLDRPISGGPSFAASYSGRGLLMSEYTKASDIRFIDAFSDGSHAIEMSGLSRLDGFLRRILNISLALAGLVFLLPLLLVSAVLVKAQDGGPIFFSQPRMGLGGSTFHCWKFRSMVMDAQTRLVELLACDPEARAEWARDQKLRDDPRINPAWTFSSQVEH